MATLDRVEIAVVMGQNVNHTTMQVFRTSIADGAGVACLPFFPGELKEIDSLPLAVVFHDDCWTPTQVGTIYEKLRELALRKDMQIIWVSGEELDSTIEHELREVTLHQLLTPEFGAFQALLDKVRAAIES